jgi:hypothetical protein
MDRVTPAVLPSNALEMAGVIALQEGSRLYFKRRAGDK